MHQYLVNKGTDLSIFIATAVTVTVLGRHQDKTLL